MLLFVVDSPQHAKAEHFYSRFLTTRTEFSPAKSAGVKIPRESCTQSMFHTRLTERTFVQAMIPSRWAFNHPRIGTHWLMLGTEVCSITVFLNQRSTKPVVINMELKHLDRLFLGGFYSMLLERSGRSSCRGDIRSQVQTLMLRVHSAE